MTGLNHDWNMTGLNHDWNGIPIGASVSPTVKTLLLTG